MSLLHNNHWLLHLALLTGLTMSAGYFVVNYNRSAETEQMPYVNLSNDDIDKIYAVKAEMQEAKIQANSDF